MTIKNFLLATALAAGSLGTTAIAQDDVKDAGKATGAAAKKTASATKKKAAKKGTHKAARKTEEGADKVEQKTR
jgi:hypothetical protein